jgi:hypothetical protein
MLGKLFKVCCWAKCNVPNELTKLPNDSIPSLQNLIYISRLFSENSPRIYSGVKGDIINMKPFQRFCAIRFMMLGKLFKVCCWAKCNVPNELTKLPNDSIPSLQNLICISKLFSENSPRIYSGVKGDIINMKPFQRFCAIRFMMLGKLFKVCCWAKYNVPNELTKLPNDSIPSLQNLICISWFFLRTAPEFIRGLKGYYKHETVSTVLSNSIYHVG